MNQLIIFYLMTSAIHVVPMVVITLSLQYGIPVSFFPKMVGDRPPLNRGLRKLGIARFVQLFQLFDSDFRDYLTRLSQIVCVLQLMTMALIIFAITLDVPLLFIPNTKEALTWDVMYELLVFSVGAAFLHLLPMTVFGLALNFDMPLPFMPKRVQNRVPPRNEITRWEQVSQDYASILLTRFENSEKTFIYVKCRDERSGKVFKLVLCQGKEVGARPQCFQYVDDDSNLEQIIPAPVGINELDEVFIAGDN